MKEQESSPSAADEHWARTEAINWMIRRLHNLALEKYLADPTEDGYAAVLEALGCAAEELLSYGVRSPRCWPPWCEAPRDRCVPCDTVLTSVD